jgi:hypothetical protein
MISEAFDSIITRWMINVKVALNVRQPLFFKSLNNCYEKENDLTNTRYFQN